MSTQLKELSHEQYIEIIIAAETYAFNISDINEIIRLQDITPIPNYKAHIIGVINLRGNIVPIVNLHHIFGLPNIAYTNATRIVVIHYKGDYIGIVVDGVNQVISLNEIQTPPEKVGGVNGSFFSGIALVKKKLIGIIKFEFILQNE